MHTYHRCQLVLARRKPVYGQEVRNSDEFKGIFAADPQVLGVDAVKGSEMIYPVVFKTFANKQ